MKLTEMHSWFRQYAQQMGMQNVRAILPEQIDTLINTATEDVVDEVIAKSVGATNDRVITDNSKIAVINALHNLYKVVTLDVFAPMAEDVGSSDHTLDEKATKLSNFKDGVKPYNFTSNDIPSYRYIVDFAVSYGSIEIVDGGPDYVNKTRLFPVRIIEDSYLADVQNDFVLAPRARSPIIVIYGATKKKEQNNTVTFTEDNYQTFDMYFGETSNEPTIDSLYLGKLRISYIKSPVKVKYLSDVSGQNVESDLPEQLQIPMLKHAVDLYRASIQGSLFSAQQNAQAEQQENTRNNARPVNDGYQS